MLETTAALVAPPKGSLPVGHQGWLSQRLCSCERHPFCPRAEGGRRESLSPAASAGCSPIHCKRRLWGWAGWGDAAEGVRNSHRADITGSHACQRSEMSCVNLSCFQPVLHPFLLASLSADAFSPVPSPQRLRLRALSETFLSFTRRSSPR